MGVMGFSASKITKNMMIVGGHIPLELALVLLEPKADSFVPNAANVFNKTSIWHCMLASARVEEERHCKLSYSMQRFSKYC